MTKDGRTMLAGAISDDVTIMTRWHLKSEQEGGPEGRTRMVNNGIVSGKL